MPRLARAALAVLALLALAGLGLGWLLARALQGEAVQARVRAAVREATGREASWASFSASLLPPGLVVEDARVEDLATAERLELRVALGPLLGGRTVVDALVLEGLDAPVGPLAALLAAEPAGTASPPGPAGGAAPAPPPEPSARSAPRFEVRRVDVRRSRLRYEDASRTPALRLALEDVELALRGAAPSPYTIEASARAAGGGALRATGTAAPGGAVDVETTLERVDLAALGPAFGADVELAGTASGRVRTFTAPPPASGLALDATLEVADGALRAGSLSARGPLSLRASLADLLARAHGTFALDATQAELVYGGALRKPPGSAASAEGRLALGAEGRLEVDGVRVRMKNLAGEVHGAVGGAAPAALTLDAPPFDVTGWGELVPALAPLAPEGAVALEGLRLAAPPLAFGGRIALGGVRLAVPGGKARATLRGSLVGDGPALRGEGLAVELGGQRLALDVALEGLEAMPRHRVALRAERADANALATAFGVAPGTIEGPISLDARLAGPLAGGPEALAGLGGRVAVQGGPGRIAGFAPVREALLGLRGVLGAGVLRDAVARYGGDRFEALEGTLSIEGGRARTEDLVLRYPDHRLALRGSVGLAGGDLDARARIAFEGGRAAGAEVPVARIRGTLAGPQLALDPQAAVALAAALASSSGRLERKLDRWLGDGAGRDVLDALGGLLRQQETE